MQLPVLFPEIILHNSSKFSSYVLKVSKIKLGFRENVTENEKRQLKSLRAKCPPLFCYLTKDTFQNILMNEIFTLHLLNTLISTIYLYISGANRKSFYL